VWAGTDVLPNSQRTPQESEFPSYILTTGQRMLMKLSILPDFYDIQLYHDDTT
jgi:hypothetical protein